MLNVNAQSKPIQLFLTGATGFLGHACAEKILSDSRFKLTILSRAPVAGYQSNPKIKVISGLDLSNPSCWTFDLQGCDVLIHTAARVHVRPEKSGDVDTFHVINVDGTLALARQAALAKTKRFIFISSIKVNGESTQLNCAFCADDNPNPHDAYARSKYQAELKLMALAKQSGMEVVIIRPPLIYGPGVKGNFQQLIDYLATGLPLPLAAITNLRSFVSIDNLVSLIVTCVNHPRAANHIFLVSDGCDLSTPSLLKKISQAMAKPSKLWRLPLPILYFLAKMVNQHATLTKLCDNLQVDITKTSTRLNWQPIDNVDAVLARTILALNQS